MRSPRLEEMIQPRHKFGDGWAPYADAVRWRRRFGWLMALYLATVLSCVWVMTTR
jgi:hypothetical protein